MDSPYFRVSMISKILNYLLVQKHLSKKRQQQEIIRKLAMVVIAPPLQIVLCHLLHQL
jgi:hypothetical protein